MPSHSSTNDVNIPGLAAALSSRNSLNQLLQQITFNDSLPAEYQQVKLLLARILR